MVQRQIVIVFLVILGLMEETRGEQENMLKEAMLKEAMMKEAMMKENMLKEAMLKDMDTPCVALDPSATILEDDDNGYGLQIGGNPDHYLPGQLYTVRLTAQEKSSSLFEGFELRVWNSAITSAGSAGSYQLLGDVLTRFSDHCTNTVIHASQHPKKEIQVLWTAPRARSGCVVFQASVQDTQGQWARGGGRLSRRLCEEVVSEHTVSPLSSAMSECCACEEAKYELDFQGLWSKETHPRDFPTSQFLLHFSDIIGASHSADYRLWEYGGYSSKGLEQVAKWGSTRLIESELKLRSDHIRTIIKARGLWYPRINGNTFAVFRTDATNHLVSLVSMLGPSPDWIVGVSGLDLCLANCSWLARKELFLYPWDAGVDDGVTYEASDQPTFPHTPITRITSRHPDDPRQPFYEASGKPMLPVAKLTISRQRLYAKTCGDNHDLEEHEIHFDLNLEEDRDASVSACSVSPWSAWSECDCNEVTTMMRTRTFVMEQKANMMQCKRQLLQKRPCTQCNDASEDVCSTGGWSEWSECSATCGSRGVISRRRNFLHRMGHKKCEHVDTVERRPCPISKPNCPDNSEEMETENNECAVTSWSAWSPCSVTCGQGSRVRTRLHLRSSISANCQQRLMEKENCYGSRRSCVFDPNEARIVCSMPKEVGPCRGFFPRWHFDSEESGRCQHFVYGGCRGNSNNFESYDQCIALCFNQYDNKTFQTTSNNATRPEIAPRALESAPEKSVDCLVTAWSPWSPCSATCGTRVFRSQFREIRQNSIGNGQKCPKRLRRRRKCRVEACPIKCPISEWGEWSPCSKSCGNDGVQHRLRNRLINGLDEEDECPPMRQQRICRLQPCLN